MPGWFLVGSPGHEKRESEQTVVWLSGGRTGPFRIALVTGNRSHELHQLSTPKMSRAGKLEGENLNECILERKRAEGMKKDVKETFWTFKDTAKETLLYSLFCKCARWIHKQCSVKWRKLYRNHLISQGQKKSLNKGSARCGPSLLCHFNYA